MDKNKKFKIDLDAFEETYRLNFYNYEKDVMEFSQSSWNLTALFLSSLDGMKKLTPQQKVCIYMVGKSMRLLRSVSKLVSIGYWPEAEILFRALFETQVLLAYVLRDETGKRAKIWLDRRNAKERWPMAEMLKGGHKSLEIVYSNLSLYPHSHIISVIKYIEIDENNMFSISHGPLGGEENKRKASQVLGSAAMTTSSICELSAPYFNLPSAWQDAHIKHMELPYFQSQQPMVKEFLSNEENIKMVQQFLNRNYEK